MFKSVLLFVASLVLVYGQSTEVAQCTQYGGELPINAEVVGCVTPPCRLPQLQDAEINIIFRAPKTMMEMKTVVTAYLSVGFVTVPVPYDLQENSVTCNFLVNTYCPVLATEVVQYRLKMYIEPLFPVGTSTTLEFRINDNAGQPFICIRLAAQIVDPVESNSLRNGTLIN